MSTELYRHFYDREWERRGEIRQAAALPMGILTLLGSLLGVFVKTFSFEGELVWLFVPSFVLAIAGFAFAVAMIVKMLFGPMYKRVPWAAEVRRYQAGLVSYYRDKPGGAAAADAEFETFLIERFNEATDKNAENNDNASEFLYKANRASLIALVFTALAGVPYVIDHRLTSRRDVDSIHITTGVSMAEDQNSGSDVPPPPPETKPIPPQNIDVRTGNKAPEVKTKE